MNSLRFTRNGLSYTLYLEDNSLVKNLPPATFDVIICDGPYGINDGCCPWDQFDLQTKQGRRDFYDYYHKLFSMTLPTLKDSGSLFIFNYPEGATIIKSVLDEDFQLVFRRWIAWCYNNHFDFERGTNFRRAHETILYYTGPGGGIFNPPAPPDVITHPILKASESDFKEGAKPLEVIKILLEKVAVPGGHLLSLFAGSGTDFLAAWEFGMSATGFEFNPRNAEIMKRRLVANGFRIE